jgi:hypothetical protein
MIGKLGKQFQSTLHNRHIIPIILRISLDHHLNHLDNHLNHLGNHQNHLGNHLNHLGNHLKPQGIHLEDLIQLLLSIRRSHQRNHTGSLANLIHVILVMMPFLLSGGRCLSSKDG